MKSSQTTSIACVAIDDEPLALDLIESYVNRVPYLNLRGRFHRVADALKTLHDEKIDLLYLDVDMPDVSGIDFLKSLSNPPRVIFVTAYDQFALEGFEVHALDYLLKPVPFSRFLKSADRAYEIFQHSTKVPNYILIKVEHSIIKISLEDIFFIEGYKDYLKIHTADSKPILTLSTLSSIQEVLPPEFIRFHRSFIVSINKLSSYKGGKVTIKGKSIPIGDSYRDDFYNRVIKGHII